MIETKQLSVGYRNRIVLENVNLTFSQGTVTALIGANGCGKSTLLKTLGGLQSAHAGSVYLQGQPIHHIPRRKVARSIGYLSQSPQAPEGISVQQMVAHGGFARTRLFARTDNNAVVEVLKRLSLLDLAQRPFATLSGGERQRAWIALVLLQSPKLLILDEPTSFLDLGHQIELLTLLEELVHERNLGVIMVLHDLNQASRFADRIIALHEGQILRTGIPKDVIEPDLIKTIFNAKTDVKIHQKHPYILPVW
jgi:iron complex transport system ATP-binding protein